MSMVLFAAALQAATSAPPPVTNWEALPPFPLPRAAAELNASTYVRAEVEAGRCRATVDPLGGTYLAAPVAILVGASGQVRQIVPRAIGCPTVEQYTVGYLLSLTRAGPGSAIPPAPGWYGLTVSYRW